MKELLRWFVPDAGIFAELTLHGNTKWLPTPLVCLALCWAWAEAKHVTDAFDTAVEQCRLLGMISLGTYQGFMNALATWTDPLLRRLWPVLHQRMEQIGGSFWRVGKWVPIAFDGSRSTVPRTQSAEQAFCAPNYGGGETAKYRKKKSKGMRRRRNEKNKPQPQAPQTWITLLWHMGLRLPWSWRLGPSNSSEREHVLEMLNEGGFRKHTLFCGDAGFVGYPLWSAIIARGHHFLVRVGANVELLTKMNCVRQKGGPVLSWPGAARQSHQPPLALRLVHVKVGKTWMWMLTSVLDSRRLNHHQIIKLYAMRWGIEIEFRGLKQTLDRAKLRCRNDRRLLAELNWSILAMAVVELFALREQLPPPTRATTQTAAAIPIGDPQRRSLAGAMRALRYCLNHLESAPQAHRNLRWQLRQAVTDDYVRKSAKRSRYRRPNPDKKPLGHPNVRRLTPREIIQLNACESRKTAA
ncbi:MAG: transposase [Pirellulales bacterium]